MKKLLSLALAVSLALALSACGDQNASTTPSTSPQETPAASADAAPSPQEMPETPADTTSPAEPENLTLEFDKSSLEELIPGVEYQLEGMVIYKTDAFEGVEYNEESVIGKIRSLEGEINNVSFGPPEGLDVDLTYPYWLVAYETGGNEDTRQHIDLYIQTDAGDFRFSVSAPIDFIEDYQDDIKHRINSVKLV